MISRRKLMAGASAAVVAAAMPAGPVPIATLRGVPIFADASKPTLAEWWAWLEHAQQPEYFVAPTSFVQLLEAEVGQRGHIDDRFA